MGTTRLSVRRAGSAVVFAAFLLAGCGGDEASTGESANGNAGEQTPEGDDTPSGDGGGADGPTAQDDSDDTDDPDSTGESGSDDAPEESPTDGAGGDESGEDAETLEISIADGEVSPPFDTYEVALGAEVRIEITSDTADEVHLHGYDMELALEPGEVGVLMFTADIEGRFELEAHDLGLPVLQLEVE